MQTGAVEQYTTAEFTGSNVLVSAIAKDQLHYQATTAVPLIVSNGLIDTLLMKEDVNVIQHVQTGAIVYFGILSPPTGPTILVSVGAFSAQNYAERGDYTRNVFACLYGHCRHLKWHFCKRVSRQG